VCGGEEDCRCDGVDRHLHASALEDVRGDVRFATLAALLIPIGERYIGHGIDPERRMGWATYAAAEQLRGSSQPRYRWRPTDRPLLEQTLQRELDAQRVPVFAALEIGRVFGCRLAVSR
jgi:hypothetical protein